MADPYRGPSSKVSVWTNSASPARSSRTLAFFHRSEFTEIKPELLAPDLQYVLEQERFRQEPWFIIFCVHDDDPALDESFSQAFLGFPPNLLRDLRNARRRGRGTAVLPSVHQKSNSMSFLINYVLATDDAPGEPSSPGSKPGSGDAKFVPIAGWISNTQIDSTRHHPAVVLACLDATVPERLQAHYDDFHRRRRLRLFRTPAWLFLDLLIVFNRWSEIWGLVRQELMQQDLQVNGATGASSLLQMTRALHRDTANVIALREDLRLHVSALQKYRSLVHKHAPRSDFRLVAHEDQEELEDRIEDHVQNLEHLQETSQVILRQLENLLSLAFNIGTATQAGTLARLNVLAIAFLPLSFVATVFGMTKFTISAAWYPLWAFIVFAAVATLAFSSYLGTRHERFPTKSGRSHRSRETSPPIRLQPTSEDEESNIGNKTTKRKPPFSGKWSLPFWIWFKRGKTDADGATNAPTFISLMAGAEVDEPSDTPRQLMGAAILTPPGISSTTPTRFQGAGIVPAKAHQDPWDWELYPDPRVGRRP